MFDFIENGISLNKSQSRQDRLALDLDEAGIQEHDLVAIASLSEMERAIAIKVLLDKGIVPVLLRESIESADCELRGQVAGVLGDGLVLRNRNRSSGKNIPADCALVISTSGTTKSGKSVMWSWAGILYQSRMTAKRQTYAKGHTIYSNLALNSAYGLSVFLMGLCEGLRIYRAHSKYPKRQLGEINALSAYGIETFPGFYKNMGRFLERNQELRCLLKSVAVLGCGGDVLSTEVSRSWYEMLGQPILDGYGQTEAGPNIAVNGPHDYKPGSVGRLLEGCDFRIIDDELRVRSPSVMLGYVEREIPLPLDEEGWLRTGDQVTVDAEGFLFVTGRIQNRMLIKGVNVYPELIESQIGAFPGVKDVAVGPYRNPSSGEIVLIALIVAGEELDTLRLKEHIRTSLGPTSLPRKIFFRQEIKRNLAHKIDRTALHALIGSLCEEQIAHQIPAVES